MINRRTNRSPSIIVSNLEKKLLILDLDNTLVYTHKISEYHDLVVSGI